MLLTSLRRFFRQVFTYDASRMLRIHLGAWALSLRFVASRKNVPTCIERCPFGRCPIQMGQNRQFWNS